MLREPFPSGTAPPAGDGWVQNGEDCCDLGPSAAAVHPDYSGGPTVQAAEGCADPYDWNCDGQATVGYPTGECSSFTTESSCPTTLTIAGTLPACGVAATASACAWRDGECVTVGGTAAPLPCE